MDDRQKSILTAIIEEHINTAAPVSSSTIVEKYDFDLSPATIRHEMAALEKENFINQPHTSAGRAPTDRGYRFYLDYLINKANLTPREKQLLDELVALQDEARFARFAATLLAHLSRNLAISAFPERETAWNAGLANLLKEPEFCQSASEVGALAEKVEHLVEDNFHQVESARPGQVQIYVGEENPYLQAANCAMIVSSLELPNGSRGVVALIGPKRMKYAKNVSLMEYLTKLISGPFIIIVAATTLNVFI